MGAGLRVPTPQQAHETLVQALQEQASWEQRARTAKELLKELLTSRREAADLAAQYDTRCARLPTLSSARLPSHCHCQG